MRLIQFSGLVCFCLLKPVREVPVEDHLHSDSLAFLELSVSQVADSW